MSTRIINKKKQKTNDDTNADIQNFIRFFFAWLYLGIDQP